MHLQEGSVASAPHGGLATTELTTGYAAGVGKLRDANLVTWIGPLLSLGLLAAVWWQLRTLRVEEVLDNLPRQPLVWVVFAIWYLAGPAADWMIFRRLWGIPVSGFAALARKLIGNELLLGYSGELYFYSWARAQGDMAAAPFGAIKDVAVLSALIGNFATLAMLCLTYPFLPMLNLGGTSSALALSLAVILGTSVGVMLLRRKLFGLTRSDLVFVSLVHAARIIVQTGLLGLMWHLALPGQPLALWLLLATMRLLISRLPLVPNKDLVFAGLAPFIVGNEVALVSLTTTIAGVTLMTHVVIGTILSWRDLMRWIQP